jgi:SAM-dependent methyltransferase
VRLNAESIYVRAAEENRRAIVGMMEPRPGCVLLDVGCADGTYTVPLIQRVQPRLTIGLELADQFIDAARAKGIDVRQTDITERWPLEDSSVDVVHSNQVIEHVSATDHFMREIRRLLSPEGYAVVSTNNLSSWHNVIALIFGWQPLPCHVSDEAVVGNPLALEEQRYGERIHRHLRLFTGRALSALAREHGLEVESAVGSGYYPLGPRASRVMARLDPTHAAYIVQRYRRGTDTREKPVG